MSVEITWEVYDGYCGSRPQTLTVEDYEVEGMDEAERKAYYEQQVHDAFHNEISWEITDVDEDLEDEEEDE